MKPFKAWVLVHKQTGEVRRYAHSYCMYTTRAEARGVSFAPFGDASDWKPVRVEVTPCK
jgi:hypothetical protein